MRARYGLIFGQGRSGTNWLLELFDQSPETFCRNEPYGAENCRLNELAEHRFYSRPDQHLLDEKWDEAVTWTANRMGNRDHEIPVEKEYLNELSRKLGLYHAVQGARIRPLMRLFIPSLRGDEWCAPRWIANREKLAGAAAILKLVTSPGWAVFVLRRRPEVPVFHIVRHPGGFLNSWANRWAAGRDMAENRKESQERLRPIAELDAKWAERFGDISSMSVEEAELWYWVYANQVIYEAGKDSRRYRHIIYEELATDPVSIMKKSYADMGLGWDRDIEARIARSASRSKDIASVWREKLSPERLRLVDDFLGMELEFYPSSANE